MLSKLWNKTEPRLCGVPFAHIMTELLLQAFLEEPASNVALSVYVSLKVSLDFQ